ncbi:MAG: rhodanese-like domain-containing protein [Magnetococcales bacterium]|nr:rhodanese-like domain-containing protein [Magnetococcales bacterium]
MSWLQDNATTLLLITGTLAFFIRGPMLARLAGVEQLGVHDVAKRLASPQPLLLLDVRSPAEYATGHAPRALLVPLPELRSRLEELRQHPAAAAIAVICQSGNRSLNASVLLKRSGFPEVYNVIGGMNNWKVQGYPIIT